MIVVLKEIIDTASNIKTFVFIPQKPVRYTAGQFIELTIPHDTPDNRGTRRWFTLSSSPTEDYVSITTKFAGTPIASESSSFKKALFALQPGSEIMMSSPMGDFVLPKDTSKPLVFIAGGIGVTPMRSMIKYMVDAKDQRTVHLIYAANNISEVAFDELFAGAQIRYTKVLKTPPDNWNGETGTLNAEKIMQLAGSIDQVFYISGPEPMVEAIEKSLKGVGVRNIIGDFFPNYTVV